jgi:predicted neuraminidase
MKFIVVLLFLCGHAAAQSIQPNISINTLNYEHIFGDNRPFKQCHASTLIGLKNGRYLFAWFAGTEEKNNDVGIWMADGKPGNWSAPHLAVKIRNEPHWNPVLFKTKDGKIFLFFKVGKEIDYWETWVMESPDDGKTWSQARELVKGNKGGRGPVRNQPIVLSNGDWLAPASIEHNRVWNAFVDRSEDDGNTWTASDTLQIDRKIITGEGIIQPALWESQPGQVHMLLRSSSGSICRSDSKDYGKTWSAVYKTDLPNNNSGIDVAQVSGDTVAVIYNPVSENWGDRFPISIALSTDNGKTWPYHFDIEKGQGEDELSYPDMFYENGNLVACYTWNRQSIAFWKGKINIAEPRQQALFQSQQLIFPLQEKHVHGSTITALPNGDILAAWFYGSGERNSDDVKIMGARLKKGSKKWSAPFEMADTYNIPDCNPVLFVNKKEELFLFWIAVQANKWEQSLLRYKTSVDFNGEGAPKWNWQDNIMLKPTDAFSKEVDRKFKHLPRNGDGWAGYAPRYDDMIKQASADATKRSYGWMTRIQPLTLKSGRILLPLYSDGLNMSIVAISDDDGHTWRPSLPIVGRGPIQPALATKKNGDIIAMMRDSGNEPTRVQQSISHDDGESWAAAQKTGIPNTASAELLNLKDGRWAFVGNDEDDGRYRLSLYISDDEGKTWKSRISLENHPKNEGNFSYPGMCQTADGILHITYSYHESSRSKSIKYVALDLSKK